MGGLGDELLAGIEGQAQAFHEGVDGVHQGQDLARRGGFQRREVVRGARGDGPFDLLDRLQGAADGDPGEQPGQCQEPAADTGRREGDGDRERTVGLAGLGHGDEDGLAGAAGEDGAADAGDPHGVAAVAGGEEQRGVFTARQRSVGQVRIAGDERAPAAGDAIEHPVFSCQAQHLQGGVGQVDGDRALDRAHLLGNGDGGRAEDVVLGGIGGPPGDRLDREVEQHREAGEDQQELADQPAPEGPGRRCQGGGGPAGGRGTDGHPCLPPGLSSGPSHSR